MGFHPLLIRRRKVRIATQGNGASGIKRKVWRHVVSLLSGFPILNPLLNKTRFAHLVRRNLRERRFQFRAEIRIYVEKFARFYAVWKQLADDAQIHGWRR